jgi:ferric-dicitrate binding protein FerR (iron transport regulator)
MERKNKIWALMGKKTAGEINENELLELNKLLNEEGQGIHYMTNVMEHYWESVNAAPENAGLLERSEQNKRKVIEGLVTRDYLQRIPLIGAIRRRKLWLSAAAVVILIITGGILYRTFNVPGTEMNIVATKNGSKTKITLPDGTQVWLNADSKLTYPNDFQHISTRQVTLSGEAFFEVIHDGNHPFVIHTRYLNIEDLGTSFNVRAYPNDGETEATLINGSITVSLRNDPGKNLLLKPGEKVLYYASDRKMSLLKDEDPDKIQENKNIHSLKCAPKLEVTHIKPLVVSAGDTVVAETAWMKNQLVFSSQKFSQLAHRLSRWYNVQVVIRDKRVENYTFTGIFEGETIEQALKELQMIRPFSFDIIKDKVIINDPGS